MAALAHAPRKMDKVKLGEFCTRQQQNRGSKLAFMQKYQSLQIKADRGHRYLGRCRAKLKAIFKLASILHFGVSFVEVPNLQLSGVHCQNESFRLESFFGYKSVFSAFLRQQSLADDGVE
jgi:hypothetical protein